MMRKRIAVALLLIIGALCERPGRSQTVPTVRIGLTQNAPTVSILSAQTFTVQQNQTRTAKFTMVVALDPVAGNRVLTRADLQYRPIVEIDGGRIVVVPKNEKVRIDLPGNAGIEVDNRTYRGSIEVFGNKRNTFTVVNELPLEDYLLGVVHNELSPTTFQQVEALKAKPVADRKDAVLEVAGISNFSEAQHFMGLAVQGEPASSDPTTLASFIRQSFFPNVLTSSDLSFLTEQGILSASDGISLKEILFRLVDKKAAFEWQQGVLISWDGTTMKLLVDGQPKDFDLSPDAPIYQRVGDERLPMRQGSWIGGELMDFRAVGSTIQMLVYRINFANPAADRYSRLALWQVHKTRRELDAALKAVNVGAIRDMRVIDRGPSERPVMTEIIGASGRRTVRALRLRTLLGLRDSLFSFDIERNAQGEVLGMMFYGRGWGHGVGMCQVGAYGMALEGATYEEILKKYYKGIELKKLY